MTKRKGISFTLTLVVIGVVLLMTALVVIVGGGGSIMDFFQRGGEGSLDAAVSQACAQKAQQINSNYCSMYVDTDADGCDVRRNPSSDYDTLVENSENCNDWSTQGGENGPLADIVEGNDVTVTVQGNDYDCVAEGELSSICPA